MLPKLYERANFSKLDASLRVVSVCDAFVFGPVESGKTYWACAHANHWRKKTMFITASGAVIRYQSAMTGKDEFTGSGWLDHLVASELLILDDFGAANPDDRSAAFLLEVLSERESWQRPTIVTSNLKLSQLDARFQSRLGGYKIVAVTGVSRRIARGGEIKEADRNPDEPYQLPEFLRQYEGVVQRWLAMTEQDRRDTYESQRNRIYGVRHRLPNWLFVNPGQCHTYGNLIATVLHEATLVEKEAAQNFG